MKIHSLCQDHLYRKAYKKGKKYVGDTVVVYSLRDLKAEVLKKQNPQKIKINRIGITVTSSIGGAVVRNRVKRIIREAYRQLQEECEIKCGFLIVIAARKSAARLKTGDVKADLLRGLDSLGLVQ